ncbi:MAG: hypothetical protein ACON4T_08275 [Synechococcus sp.]
MGFFDRLLNPGSSEGGNSNQKPQPAKKEEAFFLDSDSSSSLGDRDYMREAKTIRRTFPGTADSPGGKELVTEVAAMDLKVETQTEGLGGVTTKKDIASVTGGVPKPVKKTFAETMSKEELQQRMKGSALSTNTPAAPDAAPVARKAEIKQAPKTKDAPTRSSAKPGSIDPFREMVRNLNK